MSNIKKKVYSYTRRSETENDSERLSITDFSISTASSHKSLTATQSTKTNKESAVDLSSLKSKCEQLLPYANFNKEALSPKVHTTFMEVVNLGIKVGGTEQYNEFHTITNKVFGSVKNPVKRSIAEQFIGCSGNKSGCDEGCAGNFPAKNYTKDNFCETHVAVYDKGIINLHFSPSKPSSVLLIHSTSPDVVIDAKSTSFLKSKGISTVQVMRKNTTGQKEVKTYNLDKLACNKPKQPTKKDDCDKEDTSCVSLLIMFVILILVILLIVGGIYWFNSGSGSNTGASKGLYGTSIA